MYSLLPPERSGQPLVQRLADFLQRCTLLAIRMVCVTYSSFHCSFLQSFKNTKAFLSSHGHPKTGCGPDLACKPEFANSWSTFMGNYEAGTWEHRNSFLYPTILMTCLHLRMCIVLLRWVNASIPSQIRLR